MPDTITTRGRHLNHVAWLYDPVIERLSFGRERMFRQKTLQYMDFSPHSRILDIGCGTGTLTALIAGGLEPPGKVTGIDAAPRMIAIARRKAAQQGVAADFAVGLAERLDLADNSFDVVVNSMFAHHVDHELKTLAFREMYRVLKPGGRLFTVDIDRPATIIGAAVGWGARFLLLQEELVDNLRGNLPALMGQAGFSAIRHLEQVYGLVSFYSASRPGGR